MKLNELVDKLSEARRGVAPAFSRHHVLMALIMIRDNEPIGRSLLSKKLGISETSTRTLVRRLKAAGIVGVDRVGGVYLTDYGRNIVRRLLSRLIGIYDLDASVLGRLKLDHYAIACVLNSVSAVNEVTANPVKWRDELVRSGASAGLIIIIFNSKPLIPLQSGNTITSKDYPELENIKEVIKPPVNAVIMISYSDDRRVAEKSLYETIINFLSHLVN